MKWVDPLSSVTPCSFSEPVADPFFIRSDRVWNKWGDSFYVVEWAAIVPRASYSSNAERFSRAFFPPLMPKDSSPDRSPFTVTCVLISTLLQLTFAQDCTLETACSDCTKESSVSVHPCSWKGNFNLSYNLGLQPVALIWNKLQSQEELVIHTNPSDKSYSQTRLTKTFLWIYQTYRQKNYVTVILYHKSKVFLMWSTWVISLPQEIFF